MALLACLWHVTLRHYGSGVTHAPESAPWVLNHRAQHLLNVAMASGKDKTIIDAAVHIRSHGQLSGPGFSNHSHTAPTGGIFKNPWAWWQYRRTASAAHAAPGPDFDGEYFSQLLRQIRAMPGDYRARILARAPPGSSGPNKNSASVPVVTNRYVTWLASRAPNHLTPVVSLVPGATAVGQRLTHWIKQGVKHIRWLPVRQHINLASPAAKMFYNKLAKAHAKLMLPVGRVRDGKGKPQWIRPGAIKPALAAGVSVELTLAGASGPNGQQLMPALFHLLATSKHAKHITIDLTGVLSNHAPRTLLKPLLAHPQYYRNLQYASNYPHSAVAGRIDVHQLAAAGFINPKLVTPLEAIDKVNPLAFSLVVMRNVHLPQTQLGFPSSVFESKKSLE